MVSSSSSSVKQNHGRQTKYGFDDDTRRSEDTIIEEEEKQAFASIESARVFRLQKLFAERMAHRNGHEPVIHLYNINIH